MDLWKDVRNPDKQTANKESWNWLSSAEATASFPPRAKAEHTSERQSESVQKGFFNQSHDLKTQELRRLTSLTAI